jgi:hypothetical protein
MQPQETDLDWAYWNSYLATPTLNETGGNTLVIDLRSKRKIQELNQAYLFTWFNGLVAASTTFKLVARTLLALP